MSMQRENSHILTRLQDVKSNYNCAQWRKDRLKIEKILKNKQKLAYEFMDDSRSRSTFNSQFVTLPAIGNDNMPAESTRNSIASQSFGMPIKVVNNDNDKD